MQTIAEHINTSAQIYMHIEYVYNITVVLSLQHSVQLGLGTKP